MSIADSVQSPGPDMPAMRDKRDVDAIDTIDRELELLATVSASIRRLGGTPNTTLIDELLDERNRINRG